MPGANHCMPHAEDAQRNQTTPTQKRQHEQTSRRKKGRMQHRQANTREKGRQTERERRSRAQPPRCALLPSPVTRLTPINPYLVFTPKYPRYPGYPRYPSRYPRHPSRYPRYTPRYLVNVGHRLANACRVWAFGSGVRALRVKGQTSRAWA
eukprot:897667-Rhodomonas_salina.1